jgi:D-alanine transaminase
VIVHLNGRLVAKEAATVSVFDRGFLFGDGVYEGLRGIAWGGGEGRRIVGIGRHIERMRRGLESARIGWDPSGLERMSLDLLAANGLTDAFVYWQVTRGTPGPADPVRSRVPGAGTRPTVFGYCSAQPALVSFTEPPQKSAIMIEDRRWLLGRLKSISLMGNVLAALEADAAGSEDAIFVRSGLVAEGLATNVVLALHGPGGRDTLVTPSLEAVPILAGVTRDILLEAAPEIEARAVTVDELRRAGEVMLIGTTTMVTSVVRLDGRVIGTGEPGPRARRLLATLLSAIREGA